jgi:hypothetical protein
MSPTVTVIPVERPPHGEVLVFGARVGHVPHQHVDIVSVLFDPTRVDKPNQSSRENEVAIVKVVVVVARVAEIRSVVACDIGR